MTASGVTAGSWAWASPEVVKGYPADGGWANVEPKALEDIAPGH